MRVLLVEDNDDDALLIRESLSETKLEIHRAERLSTALEQLALGGFDAVLLDLSLPDAWGLDTIGRLRQQSAAVPIVVLTGLNDEEVAMRAVEEGAQDYLIKGQVDGPLLARSLRYAIQRHKAEEALKERNRELLILQKISETILGSLDLKAVLEKILAEAMASESFDLGNIRLLDRSGEMLTVVVSRGYRHPENGLSHRALARTAESRQSKFGVRLFHEPCIEEQLRQSGGFRTLKNEDVESFIMVPVRANGEVLGTLQLASRTPRKFKSEEVNLLQTIGNQMGIAVQKVQLYEETARQAVELERANKLQADFTAMIAHDLRSPLMNIMGVAEVMIEGMFGGVTAEQKKWLARIQSNSQSLIDLVSDFLDVSKLESGYVDVNRETVDLAGLIQKSVESYRVRALNKKISIRGSADATLPFVHADPRRLEQVLSNLISNAIKFTGEGGKVEVEAALADGPQVNVWVRDNGIGIAADEISQLFEKYRQGGNVKHSSHKGTGLGLVICKMIIGAHGGRIWVDSEPARGSTFYFSLPASLEDDRNPKPA
ncbi:MAG: ATP-binding protein [Candidatus Binatia bacterium]|jgi:signal transduction histidine kinase/DNA-binding response OmpR family regulator